MYIYKFRRGAMSSSRLELRMSHLKYNITVLTRREGSFSNFIDDFCLERVEKIKHLDVVCD